MKCALIGGRNWQYISEVLVLREEIANGFINGVTRFTSANKIPKRTRKKKQLLF